MAFAAGIAAVATPVFAQEAAPAPTVGAPTEEAGKTAKVDEKAVKLEAVKVTGTRISVPGATSSSPIVTLRAEEFSLQQTPEVEQVLRNLPSTLPSDGANVNNGTAGVATIDLRGLGSNRSLVLIDGKRLTPYDINGLVDTSIIPTALLERVDLVTGGASAVYGSDALAGAVNVIMKRNFEGLDITYRNGITEEGDGDKSSLAIAMGSNVAGGKGNVSMALTYAHRDGIQLGQRPLGQLGIVTEDGAGLAEFLAGQGPTAAPAGCGGPGSVVAGGSTTTLPTRLAIFGVTNPAAGFQFRDDGSLGDNCSVFNFNPFNYYETPQDRYGGAVFGRFEFNEHAEAYSRFLYSNTTVRQQVAPSGVFGSTFFTPLANPFITDSALATITGHANANIGDLDDSNWVDVNGNGMVDEPDRLALTYRRRTVEFGERSTTYDNNSYQAVFGMRGLIFSNATLGDWDYDVSFQRGQSQSNRVNAGYSNLTNVGNALDSVDGVTCANGDTSCVPLNLFGGFGSITPEMARYSSATALEARTYTQYVTNAVINGSVDIGSPFADRPLGISIGVERRRENGSTVPDECLKLAPASCLGGAGGNTLPISGGFSANELFTELLVPLVDGKFLAKSLDLSLGYRWSDYNPSGLSKTWKYGLSWEPMDGLLARVEHQRAARAPNVGELAAPQTTGLSNAAFDPCSVGNPVFDNGGTASDDLIDRCVATGVDEDDVGEVEDIVSGQINGFFGTDLNALPGQERGDTTTFGVVWQPRFIPAIRNAYLSLDYYDIKVTDYIGTFGAQEILDACYTAGIDSECAKVRRIGGTLTADGSGVELFTTNLKYLNAEGLELVTSFDVKAGNFVKVKFALDANYYFSQESQSSTFSDIIDCRGYYGTQCGNPLPTFRSVQRTTVSVKDFDVSYLWRYIGGVSVENPQVATTFERFQHIGGTSYFDASVGYTFRKNYRISALATNLLDKDPPVVGNEAGTTDANSGNTFPSVYDVLGRTYSVSISAKF